MRADSDWRCPTHARITVRPGSECPWCHITYNEISRYAVARSACHKVNYDRRFMAVALVAGWIEG